MKNKPYFVLSLLIVIAALALSACGGAPATQDPFIQTAVAQTVAAKNAEQQAPTLAPLPPSALDTPTPPMFSPTATGLPALPTSAASDPYTSPCGKAAFVSETIVDGTIFKPGEQFTKTWEIKNTSSCAWDTNYKLVYWGGDDMMGGAYYYNLPQSVPPGGVVPISIHLTAPLKEGEFTSKWALQTPDKINFGVGEYSNVPITVKIVVSAATKPQYAVTKVTYKLVREPADGCPANVWYYAYATVYVNGPLEFKYYWSQSDGNNVKYPDVIKATEAGAIELPPHSWKFYIADSPGPKWMMLNIGISDGENYIYTPYPPGVEFVKTCGS